MPLFLAMLSPCLLEYARLQVVSSILLAPLILVPYDLMDWINAIVPVVFVIGIAVYSKKYVWPVVDWQDTKG